MQVDVEELFVEQGSPEWFDARKGRITSSEINSVVSKGKDGTSNSSAMRANLLNKLALERITGQRVVTYKSAAMQQGNDLEATAALAYTFATGKILEECGFFKRLDGMYGSSPDRKVIGENGIVQFKCFEPTEHKEVLKKREVPPKYFRQCVDELANTNFEYNDFASYNGDFPENAQLFIKRIWRKDVLGEIQELEDAKRKLNEEIEAEVTFIKDYKEE